MARKLIITEVVVFLVNQDVLVQVWDAGALLLQKREGCARPACTHSCAAPLGSLCPLRCLGHPVRQHEVIEGTMYHRWAGGREG